MEWDQAGGLARQHHNEVVLVVLEVSVCRMWKRPGTYRESALCDAVGVVGVLKRRW